MDERMEYLERLLESDVVGYHNFTLKYDNRHKGKVVYCFTEGEDYKYYKSRIDAVTTKDSIFIDCKGREGVIEALELIKSFDIYNEDLIIGFIDRDFFQVETPSNILMTDYYSIESYYCRETAVKDILELHCKLINDLPLYVSTIDQYTKLYTDFIKEISFFSVWCYFQVISTQEEKREFLSLKDNEYDIFSPRNCIYLNKFKLFNHIDLSLESLSAPMLQSENDIISLSKKAFGKARLISDKIVQDHLNTLSESELLLLIRGKFELQFLSEFLKLKIKDLNTSYGKGISQNIEDLLSLFSTYAVTSPNLRVFLDAATVRTEHILLN